jgi:hypothetical protein
VKLTQFRFVVLTSSIKIVASPESLSRVDEALFAETTEVEETTEVPGPERWAKPP